MMAVLGSKPFVLNLPTNELLSQDVDHVDVAKTPRNSFIWTCLSWGEVAHPVSNVSIYLFVQSPREIAET